MGRLLAVRPDGVELLAVVTLRETSLGLVSLFPDCNIVTARQCEYLMDFDALGKVIRNRGIFTVVVPSAGGRRVVDICLTLIISKPRFTNPSPMSSAGAETGRCCITAFTGF
jgi:hypothetical protein